jgi:ATP-dependent DNA helicase RecG
MPRMDDVQHLLASGASQTVEFKKSTASLREAIETLCAFANQHGGYVIFGVDDNGTAVGQHVSDDTLKNIANAVKLNTDPKLYPTLEQVDIDGKSCILVTIEESPLKPHLAYGRAYMRVGTTNQQLDREQYAQLLQQRFNGYGFDHLIQPGATLADIDTDALTQFLETANAVRNLNESLLLPTDVVLQKLDLMTDKGLTNASLLLFGKAPEKFFRQHYEVKCGTFVSDSGYDDLRNDQEYHQNLLYTFHAALTFLLQSIHKASHKQALQRREGWEFPVGVLREALVNMLVHRDYRQDIKSTIEVRPSSIAFYNPAQLFGPTITIARLHQLHPSRPGHKWLAKIFYLMGLFENWGGGTLKIISESAQAGKPTPEFTYEDGMFRLVLFRR